MKVLRMFVAALVILSFAFTVGCTDKCKKACEKMVECKLQKDKDKCIKECKEEQEKEKDKFDKNWKKMEPHLDKKCEDFLKGLSEAK